MAPNHIQARSKHFKDVEVTQAESLSSSLTMTLDEIPEAGAIVLDINGELTAAIDWDATELEIQALVRATDPQVYVTGTLLDQELVFSSQGEPLAVSEDSNSLTWTPVVDPEPVSTSFTDVVTTRTLDLANYRDTFLEIVYSDGAAVDTIAELSAGATAEKFLHVAAYDQTIDPAGGIMQFNLNNLIPRYAQLLFPEELIVSIRLQGLRLRRLDGR